MKLGILLACVSTLPAQITVTLHTRQEGSTEIRVRNDAAVTLTAFAVGLKDSNGIYDGPLTVYADTAVDGAPPVEPNEERFVNEGRFVMRNGKRTYAVFERAVISAAMFSDGTTTGVAALVSRLILRRCNMAQAVEMALDILSDAGGRNVPREQLIRQFTRLASSLDHWYLPAEQEVGRTVYLSMIGKLKNLPETRPGAAFPPTDFVQQETALLNRQRVTLLESQPGLASAALR
jgi:hypothetical protein